MIRLRFAENCAPRYMTALSAGADLVAREGLTIKSGQRGKIPTGVWIEGVNWESIPSGMIPELQVRCRSGLAFKHGLMLTNGVGTVDLDYKDEICVLLYNSGSEDVELKVGDRVAQLVLALTGSFSNIERGSDRLGGFGSTGVGSQTTSQLSCQDVSTAGITLDSPSVAPEYSDRSLVGLLQDVARHSEIIHSFGQKKHLGVLRILLGAFLFAEEFENQNVLTFENRFGSASPFQR